MHQVMTKYALTYVGQWDLWELVSSLSACFSPLIRPFRFHLEVINHFTKASTSRNCSTKSKFWVLQQQMVGRQSFTSTFNIIYKKRINPCAHIDDCYLQLLFEAFLLYEPICPYVGWLVRFRSIGLPLFPWELYSLGYTCMLLLSECLSLLMGILIVVNNGGEYIITSQCSC